MKNIECDGWIVVCRQSVIKCVVGEKYIFTTNSNQGLSMVVTTMQWHTTVGVFFFWEFVVGHTLGIMHICVLCLIIFDWPLIWNIPHYMTRRTSRVSCTVSPESREKIENSLATVQLGCGKDVSFACLFYISCLWVRGLLRCMVAGWWEGVCVCVFRVLKSAWNIIV